MKSGRFQSSCLTALAFNVFVFLLFSLIQDQCTRATKVSTFFFNEQQCKEWGFYPTELACDTCDLLAAGSKGKIETKNNLLFADFSGECKICCQSWRVNKNPTEVGGIKPGAFISAAIQLNEIGRKDFLQGIPPDLAAQLGMTVPIDEAGGGRRTEAHSFIESGDFERLLERKGDDVIRKETTPDVSNPSVVLHYDVTNSFVPPLVIDVSNWKQDDIRDLLMYAIKEV